MIFAESGFFEIRIKCIHPFTIYIFCWSVLAKEIIEMDEIWGSSHKGQSHKIFLGSNQLNMAELSVCFFLFFPFMINVSVKLKKNCVYEISCQFYNNNKKIIIMKIYCHWLCYTLAKTLVIISSSGTDRFFQNPSLDARSNPLRTLSVKWTSFYVLYSGGHKCNSLWGVSLRSVT